MAQRGIDNPLDLLNNFRFVSESSNQVQQELSSKSHNSYAEREFKALRNLALIDARFRFRVAGVTVDRFFCFLVRTPGADCTDFR